jgi:DNA topoisomerase-1
MTHAHVSRETLDATIRTAIKKAGLRHVSDARPGVSRVKDRRGQFSYRSPSGHRVTVPNLTRRIHHLVIPPAWTDVWICPDPRGHIQATGRDARGRKQYRYHPLWQEVRDEAKYERTLAFGRALPGIRRAVSRDLRRPGLGREKILAAVVRLLETSLVRVGNEEYVRQNRSFGLSTMRDRHVAIRGSSLHFDFRGKSGIHHEMELRDRRLAEVVRKSRDLPGEILFQYRAEDETIHHITSNDVNAYLRRIAGEEFSAKDFRTWAGTVLAAVALREFERFDSRAQAKRNLLRAIESVAERLGNTPSVCRKCYIHPAVLNAYLRGETIRLLHRRATRALRHVAGLRPEEALVLAFLERQLRPKKRSR